MRRLVWIAVLSCLVPPMRAGDECATAKAATSGTCSAVATISGVASIFLCAGTLGLGCGAVAVAGAVSGMCAAVAGNIPCGGGASINPGKLFIEKHNIFYCAWYFTLVKCVNLNIFKE